MGKAKAQAKRDAGVNSLGVGDSSQGSRPSENTGDPSSKAHSEPKVPTGSSKKKRKSRSQYLGGYAGRVMVGSRHQPICIPAGSSKFIVGTAKGVPHKGSFMMEGTEQGNLPSGVTVNNTYVSPTKSGRITVCLQNTNKNNIWIWQPLYAGDLWDVDKEEWEYEPVLIKDAETNTVHVKFQQVPPEHLREEIFAQAAQMSGSSQDDKEQDEEEEKESDPQSKSQESAEEERPQFGASSRYHQC